MAALPRFISVTEAARRLGLPARDLYRMVDAGKIKAAEINGVTVVSEESVEKRIPQPSPVKKEDLPEYKKFAHLHKEKIWISEAARKYGVPATTISGWVKSGILPRAGVEKNRIILDEQDVAYCAEIYHKHGGQGKWVFNSDGTPYIAKQRI